MSTDNSVFLTYLNHTHWKAGRKKFRCKLYSFLKKSSLFYVFECFACMNALSGYLTESEERAGSSGTGLEMAVRHSVGAED